MFNLRAGSLKRPLDIMEFDGDGAAEDPPPKMTKKAVRDLARKGQELFREDGVAI